jgi:uncharacterized membrane protein YidH (DUF202 family)
MSLTTAAQVTALADLRTALALARQCGLLQQMGQECTQASTIDEFIEATNKMLRRHMTPARRAPKEFQT